MKNKFSMAMSLALIMSMLLTSVGFADNVGSDADIVTAGDQVTSNLGTVAPGATLTPQVSFALQCQSNSNHVDNGATVNITFLAVGPGGSSVPAGGSLSATNTAIGSIPGSWPDDGSSCAATTPLPDNGNSNVTIIAPNTPGPHTFTVKYSYATSNGDSQALNPNQGSVTYTLTVASQTTPTITWANPADITYGTALSATQLNATTSPAGSFVYAPASGVVLNAGAGQTLHVDFTPSDTTLYNNASKNVSINVLQAPSTVTVSCPPSVTYTGSAQTPCTASVTGAGGLSQVLSVVSYSANTNVGTVTASASYAGDANHLSDDGSATFEITQASVTATAGSGSATYDGSAKSPSACAVSGAYTGDLSCVNNPASVGPDAGTTAIAAVVSGTGLTNYDISYVAGSYTINPAPVTATAGSGSGTYNGAAQSPSACAVTGTYFGDLTCANNPASVGPDAGTTAITAVVSGTGLTNYDVTSVAGSYTINQAPSVTTVTCAAGPFYFTGAEIKPCTAVVTGAGGLNQFLTVNYTNNIAVGTATASATFAGDLNHTGSTDSKTFTINAWTLKGFYQPVDMFGVLNIVKAGSTVPLKFNIYVGGTEKTATSDVKSFAVKQIVCSTSAVVDDIELTTTGGTSLRYDTTGGQFVQNWQTPKAAGSCYQVTMTTQDLSTIIAFFKLK